MVFLAEWWEKYKGTVDGDLPPFFREGFPLAFPGLRNIKEHEATLDTSVSERIGALGILQGGSFPTTMQGSVVPVLDISPSQDALIVRHDKWTNAVREGRAYGGSVFIGGVVAANPFILIRIPPTDKGYKVELYQAFVSTELLSTIRITYDTSVGVFSDKGHGRSLTDRDGISKANLRGGTMAATPLNIIYETVVPAATAEGPFPLLSNWGLNLIAETRTQQLTFQGGAQDSYLNISFFWIEKDL